ncbi:cell division topological specificity factor MinE [Lichenicoccus sp.]|uniref:cell division topological specificity factor MinE n=1 Tax=Lichenicoccus sp. TaxID=2781899 RepID=UPI003D0EC3A1
MSLLSFFTRKNSAPVARDRLQILLAHERSNGEGQSELIAKLREEILEVIARHVTIDRDKVQVKLDRGASVSTLEIDIEVPGLKLAGARPNGVTPRPPDAPESEPPGSDKAESEPASG